MFQMQMDMKEFDGMVQRQGGMFRQLPFVASRLLNEGATKARQVLVSSTWPSHVKVRNTTFMTASLRVEYANKHNLRVVIFDARKAKSASMTILQGHAKGAVKLPHGKLAMPARDLRDYGAHGIPKSKRPSGIIARTPKRALRILPSGIYVGEGGRLHMRYSFKTSARQSADVPFYEDFEYVMHNTIRTGYADTMRNAMRTAR